jgi:hypothetical protein
LVPTMEAVWDRQAAGGKFEYFKGTQAAFSALYAAGRRDDLFALIAKSEYRFTSWSYREWGARALVAAGKHTEAIAYAEGAKGLY